MDTITLEDFKKVEIRIGKILSAEKVADADKLLKLQVDFGEFQRQIISGIAESFTPEVLVGKAYRLLLILNTENSKARRAREC